jgi:SNF2 family DNA or RNA helicase
MRASVQQRDVPATQEVPCALTAEVFPTGWAAELARAAKVRVEHTAVAIRRPHALSVRFGEKGLKTRSFSFELPNVPTAPQSSARDAMVAPMRNGVARHRGSRGRVTRIKPPGDIVKLDDRLYYTLQPPLEVLVSSPDFSLAAEPFDYQFDGIAFLYPRYSAILADEMGLGKTMQAITAMRLLLRAGEIRSVLLLCPKALVTTWQRELARWAPEVPVCVVEGGHARREWRWRQGAAPVKIANYELLLRDGELLDRHDLRFDLVVLDEAQRIKNRTSATSRAARSIARSRSWALTGTPVENSTDDLVGIFEFLAPGYLTPGTSPRRMARQVRDYILRRTKDQVLLDLPPRLVRDTELELAPQQRSSYTLAEEQGVLRLSELGNLVTIRHVFELVLRLKQICNFDPATGESSKYEQLAADLEEVAASGQKAIVFSQWVRPLQSLGEKLARFGTLEYHGQIPVRQREDVLRRFEADRSKHVLLMSYAAGSVGLNLQFCRYVFLFDRWWNPAVEDQAINRAHRIGSTGPVTVTRMLTLGTIEERINQVLEEKRELMSAVLADTGAPSSAGLSPDDLFGLFQLRPPQNLRDEAA